MSQKGRHWVQTAIPLLLFIYLVGGIATKFTHEVFPFFHWALFANVTPIVERYELRVVSIYDQIYDTPIALSELPAFREKMLSTPDIYDSLKAVNRLGSSLRKNHLRAERLREMLERNYLPEERIRYQIVKVSYKPVERYLTGNIISQRVAATFIKLPKGIVQGSAAPKVNP